ncbi:excinuclease ABC subunit UvrA [Myxococcus sp. K15C18031901]|uniref:ATP-binding cassette domain-containing protein n=1 Tax=Myxococcus dinghuensis TaxID=2906761 RepID=UPI0020A74CE4|nr:ATP-binding cassette domain-containing protein [Myxococcus dinghuensis]MCP3098084.1 excinuclease ABC subunit UvrA [Myxococcus dinghuensis]
MNTHNLKNLSVSIPKGKLVVVTGVSGSGKSSLVIDTLFYYSKSLYLGALSSRSFDMGEGDFQVERVSGTQPPVALKQSVNRLSNPRSTIGTLSGMDGLMRLFFARGGTPVCPACLGPVDKKLQCGDCGCFAEPLTPRQFSANRKEGKCLTCNGLGRLPSFSADLLVPDPSKSLEWIWDNAEPGTFSIPSQRKVFEAMCEDEGIRLDVPFSKLTPAQKNRVLRGSDKVYRIQVRKVTNEFSYDGILGYMERLYKSTSSPARQQALQRYIGDAHCAACEGGRLRKESMAVTVGALRFGDFQHMTIGELVSRLQGGKFPAQVREVAQAIQKQCQNIEDVGLGHLALDRAVNTLSGGELQRLLLAQHVASDLTGVMYVLDEPTIGLHEHDTVKLLETLRRLRDLGNTVIVIEHDETLIRAADWLIEMGPGAGARGGELVFEGTYEELMASPRSQTAACMKNRQFALERRPDLQGWLTMTDFQRNNLKVAKVAFPLNALSCVTGLSGSGKSSLIGSLRDEALRVLTARAAKRDVGASLKGLDGLDEVTYVEQKPIGRSSRSTLVTYLGISDAIRDLFASLPESSKKGFDKTHFSSNVAGGRCETCKGQGSLEIDMSIFESEYVVCDDCGGRKFQEPVLEVKLNGRNIHEVLSLSVEEALSFFTPKQDATIVQALTYLRDFGLGYLVLGSSTVTLSGGEAQRLNLAAELLRQKKNRCLFIFDEPTRGLHFADIRHLLKLFNQLLEAGHTVIIIEHNLDVIGQAHYVVDMGPEGGDRGGDVVFAGPVQTLTETAGSHTGRYLKDHLKQYYRKEANVMKEEAASARAPVEEAPRPAAPTKAKKTKSLQR